MDVAGAGDILAAATPALVVMGLAFTPEVESRGSIPVGILAYGMSPVEAVTWTLIGNLAGIPVAWRLLPWSAGQLRRLGWLRRPLDWLLGHTRRRASRALARGQEFGLLVFVGVPLPGTGAWAGVAVAHMFGMTWKRSVAPLVGGTVTAAVLVAILVEAGKLAL